MYSFERKGGLANVYFRVNSVSPAPAPQTNVASGIAIGLEPRVLSMSQPLTSTSTALRGSPGG